MGRESKPEREKIPMKTRLIIIAVTFVLVNVIFYLAFDSTDDSAEEEKIENESEITMEEPMEESTEEELYYKFNPPKP